uniref:5'-nucleotidase n=1 Tax=Steinernema glaseri TaxID=37863 RepID=A0A1I7ZKA5_9BILA
MAHSYTPFQCCCFALCGSSPLLCSLLSSFYPLLRSSACANLSSLYDAQISTFLSCQLLYVSFPSRKVVFERKSPNSPQGRTTTKNKEAFRCPKSISPRFPPPACSPTGNVVFRNYHRAPAENPFNFPVVSFSSKEVMDALLKNPRVRMRDAKAVERKLARIIEGGMNELMVISDFDYTLSRFVDKSGARCWTTHGVFDNAALEMDPTLGQKFIDLKEKYLPIEFCSTMTIAEKIPHMEDWWRTSHGHIIEARFTEKVIEKCVVESKVEIRDRGFEMIGKLQEHSVPLIIFSAGIGNVIEVFLKHHMKTIPHNVHLISNMMEFDDEGVCKSFTEPLIHTFCKNSSVINGERAFFHQISDRTNVILLGDSLGDLHMDVGVEREGVALKIGFLNFDHSRLMDKYLDGYDIVLINDSSMDVPINILEMVERHTSVRPLTNPSASRAESSCHKEAEKDAEVASHVEPSATSPKLSV